MAEHSDFERDPLRRLRHTLTFVYALEFGTPEQVQSVIRMVNGAHAPVRSDGRDGEGVAYDATDPALQVWVAATLYATALQLSTRFLGPLSESTLDTVYREYAVIGSALQMPESAWPADRAAFEVYWNAQVAALSVDDTTRRVAHTLLHAKNVPWWIRVGLPLLRLVTAGLLPPGIRGQYRMPWSPARERRFSRAMTALGVVNRVLPRAVRHLPKTLLLAGLSRHA